MSYQVLARKWRPQTFSALIGQDHVRQILTNALTQNRLHHAYLFSGTRGVGKTTIARIFAKCLNCKPTVTAEPCGECENCQAIDQGQFVDLIEVDAASRTKVDDTRELLDNAQYGPTQGRFKIYLIDEVHMLSTHSFNALLKTLEEPPGHIKFLLATTDPQRLPVTVLSRCLQFHLKLLTSEQIAAYLAYIAEQEHVGFESEALYLLAQSAKGSLRDALSLLDQAIAYSNSNLTIESVRTLLGEADQIQILSIIQALRDNDLSRTLQMTQKLAENGVDFSLILDQLADMLHRLALLRHLPKDTQPPFKISDDERHLSETLSPETIQLYYQITILGRRNLPHAPSPRSGFEMTLLRLLAFQPQASPEHSFENAHHTASSASPTSHTHETAPSTSIKQDQLNAETWPQIVNALDLEGLALQAARHSQLLAYHNNTVKLAMAPEHAPMMTQRQQHCLKAALSQYLGHSVELIIEQNHDDAKTPAKIEADQHEQQLAQAKQNLQQDPNVQTLLDTFDGEMLDVTLNSASHSGPSQSQNL